MKEKKLTAKQELFCKAYLSNGFNATESARQAGYKGNDVTLGAVGAENLKKPQIKKYIEEEKAKDSKKLNITRESLLADIQIAKDMALNSEQPQYQSYLKAIEMQAKMLGLNEPERLDVRLELEDSRPIFGA